LEVGDPERGREIFEKGGEKYTDKPQYHCIHCHSLDGSIGDGPSLKGISERADERVPGLSAVEYLRQSILEPDAYVIEGFSHQMGRIHSVLLGKEEIDDLVAFMLTQ
jgi:cytochrome c oxidase subunit 2